MREKITGIGKEIESIMKKNKISLEDLELKTGINKTLLKQFLELKKEPYLITEGGKFLPAIGLKSEEEFDIFIKKWIELSKKKNVNNIIIKINN